MHKILVVDDDQAIRDILSRYLAKEGYEVQTAPDGQEMFQVLAAAEFDLIVLDLMMPGEDGLELTKEIRKTSAIPIIILTGKGDEVDRIIGLEVGADDYMAKPFNPREVLARIKAVMRRVEAGKQAPRDEGEQNKGVATFESWRLDLAARELTSPDGEKVGLTAGEFNLLEALVTNAQRVISRDRLLDLTGGVDRDSFDRSVDVQIMRLRRKVEQDPHDPKIVKTVRGAGYMFSVDVEWS